VRPEARVSLNEAKFRLSQVSGNSGDVFVCQPDKSGPAATICTALTDVFGIGHREFGTTSLEAIEPWTISQPLLLVLSRASILLVSQTRTIDPDLTMSDLLQEFPGAQRALFRAYHIGGCSSCGFRPDETLAQVCQRNNDLPVEQVIETILSAHESEQKMQIEPEELSRRLKEEPGTSIALIDVRTREEWDAVHLNESQFLTQELMQEILSSWPKEREIVFVCHHGVRSMDAAAFFAGHGFTEAKSLAGGIDAWSVRIDSSLPRYHLE
jgi:rhodanese-related sulfurtransferase